MMGLNVDSIEIPHPAVDVFASWIAVENWPQWDSSIVAVHPAVSRRMEVGEQFRGISRNMGLQWLWTATIIEYRPSVKWAYTIDSEWIRVEEHDTFIPIECGTKLCIEFQIQVGGLRKILAPCFTICRRQQAADSLKRFKNMLESGARQFNDLS